MMWCNACFVPQNYEDADIVSTAVDILASIVEFNSSILRDHILQQNECVSEVRQCLITPHTLPVPYHSIVSHFHTHFVPIPYTRMVLSSNCSWIPEIYLMHILSDYLYYYSVGEPVPEYND